EAAENARRESGQSSWMGTYTSQNESAKNEQSSDSDYANVDMGLYGGGYEGRLSYGGASPMNVPVSRHSIRASEQRPLPEPATTNRESMYGPTGLGMCDYGLP